MRANSQTSRVIFALNRESEVEDVRLIRSLGIEHFKIGQGCYKGQSERSYAVNLEHLDKLRPLLKECGQQCVLLLDNQGNAFLSKSEDDFPSYVLGPVEYTGEFKEVPQSQALRCESWSCFQDRYYIAFR